MVRLGEGQGPTGGLWVLDPRSVDSVVRSGAGGWVVPSLSCLPSYRED